MDNAVGTDCGSGVGGRMGGGGQRGNNWDDCNGISIKNK